MHFGAFNFGALVACTALALPQLVLGGGTGLLKDVRKDIDALPSYTADEQDYILSQAALVLDVFGNRDIKLQAFGKSVDPVPKINSIRASAKNNTFQKVQFDTANAFSALRDLHTVYGFGRPHQCGTVLMPFALTLVSADLDDDDKRMAFDIRERYDIDNPQCVVDNFSQYKTTYLSLAAADATLTATVETIKQGDLLLTYNGKTFNQLLKELEPIVGGSSIAATRRWVIDYLTVRSGFLYQYPREDNVQLTFKRSSGEVYNVTLPWVASSDPLCIFQAPGTVIPVTDGGKVATPITVPKRTMAQINAEIDKYVPMLKSLGLTKETALQLISRNLTKYSNPVTVGKLRRTDFKPTTQSNSRNVNGLSYVPSDIDPKLQWTIYRPEDLKIGVLRITDFSSATSSPDIDLFVRAGKALLTTVLADTNGLIIDLRDNPGGFVTRADYFPQLFSPLLNFDAAFACVRKTKVNDAIWKTDNTEIGLAYKKLTDKDIDKYTDYSLAKYSERTGFNSYGTAYIKPVALLTNGRCFSACDFFSTAMQDNGLAIVVGEDTNTGGGGASTVRHDSFFQISYPSLFPQPLPYAETVTTAFIQGVRTKRSRGSLIENRGVTADFVVRPTISDIRGAFNAPRTQQFDAISNLLIRRAKNANLLNTTFLIEDRAAKSYEFIARPGNPPEINGTVSGIDSIFLYNEKNILVGVKLLAPTATKQRFSIKPIFQIVKPGFTNLTVQAWKFGRPIATSIRYFRVIPPLSSYFALAANTTTRLSPVINNQNVIVYNKKTGAGDGWKNVDGILQVGNGTVYANNIDTTVSFFVKAPAGTDESYFLNIAFDVTFDLENSFDFVYFTVVSNDDDSTANELIRLTGSGNLDPLTVFSVPFAKVYEIQLRVSSDENLAQTGVKLNSISVKFSQPEPPQPEPEQPVEPGTTDPVTTGRTSSV
ncbi:hypothetical protein BJ742DRAFT_33962 [Cladochytrium replicatum]|nr:hypothetical protein BJ742DRAFT_33962 [Cladochytrium replicatum]